MAGNSKTSRHSRGLMAGPKLTIRAFEIDHQVLFLKLPHKDFHSEVEWGKVATAPVTQALLTLPQLLSRREGPGRGYRVRAP